MRGLPTIGDAAALDTTRSRWHWQAQSDQDRVHGSRCRAGQKIISRTLQIAKLSLETRGRSPYDVRKPLVKSRIG
jgi:hypothetical protein